MVYLCWCTVCVVYFCFFFFQAEDGIRDYKVTGVQTCALPILRGTNLAAHEPLPLLPPLRAMVGFGWRDRFTVDVDAYDRPRRLNPLDIATPGYALVYLGGGADVRLFGRAMRLDVSLRNAFNQRYRSFLSRYKAFAFDPGRNLIVRLSSGFVD